MLKSRNMTCDIAVNGSEALKAVAEKDYDVVFMDCQMPVMDGYESTARIRHLEGNEKHTTIIAMTANAMAGDCEKCIKAGMDAYISKPIDFDKMFNMIEENVKYGTGKPDYNKIIDDNIDRFVEVTGLDIDDAMEIFEDYIKCLPDLISGIDEAIKNNEFEKLAKLTHELKGSSGTMRITSIHELAIKLEAEALKHEIEGCHKFFKQINDLF